MANRRMDRLAARTALDDKQNKKPGESALLIIDMISDYEFKDGEKIFKNALKAAKCVSAVLKKARRRKIPVIYVNDNFGAWKNDFTATVNSSLESEKGGQIVSQIKPEPDDYHVLKPQRSGFFATPLAVLLDALKVSKLYLSGVTTDICVFFTAHDAYMRGFEVIILSDCCAAITSGAHKKAVSMAEETGFAATINSKDVSF